MSNAAFNAHIEYGSPMGDGEGIFEIADWAGSLLLEIRPLIADPRSYADLDNGVDLAKFGNCECGECGQKIRLHNTAVKRLRELTQDPT